MHLSLEVIGLRGKILAFAFVVIALLAAIPVAGVEHSYDPKCDFNADGQIDIYDLVYIATRYGTEGNYTPPYVLIHVYSYDIWTCVILNNSQLRLFVGVMFLCLEPFQVAWLNITTPPENGAYITIEDNLYWQPPNSTRSYPITCHQHSITITAQGRVHLVWDWIYPIP